MDSIKSFFRVIYNNKQAFAGMIILALFLIMAVFGPLVVPLDLSTDFLNRYQFPSFRHPFGTDYVGNDLFQQIVHGSRSVLFIGLLASLFTVILGFALGALAGFAGGIADKIISMLIQVLISIPIFPVQLIIAVVFPVRNVVMLAVVLAILSWAWLARNVRAQISYHIQRNSAQCNLLSGIYLCTQHQFGYCCQCRAYASWHGSL